MKLFLMLMTISITIILLNMHAAMPVTIIIIPNHLRSICRIGNALDSQAETQDIASESAAVLSSRHISAHFIPKMLPLKLCTQFSLTSPRTIKTQRGLSKSSIEVPEAFSSKVPFSRTSQETRRGRCESAEQTGD